MTPRTRHLRRRLLAGAAALAAALPVAAQDVPDPEPPAPDDETTPPDMPPLPGASDPRAEMEQLFRTVEENLRRIDVLLSDAAAGDVSLAEVEDAGLDDLLQDGRARSEEVVRDIDRILEIARQAGASQSSSGQGQKPPPPDGESPLDRGRPRTEKSREQTPEASQQPPPGEEPRDANPSERPEDEGRPDESEPRNREGTAQDHERGSPAGADPDAERWGELPQHVRQIFRTEGADDMPVQYREWIDSYYRRLNRVR